METHYSPYSLHIYTYNYNYCLKLKYTKKIYTAIIKLLKVECKNTTIIT